MNRQEFLEYIENHYKVKPEKLWDKYPSYVVFRHNDNNKWFILIMDVPASKLIGNESASNEIFTVIDIKVNSELVGSLRSIKGIYPAYHMNKEHWVSINLDNNLDITEFRTLIENSFNLTK